jgi:5'-3' exoribonuclease 2
MGIARYFASIIKKNPKVYTSSRPSTIDNLFIDFNAMVYKAIIDLDTGSENLPDSEYEDNVIKKTSVFLIDLVKNINPKKMLYIAMDGPVPRAKMIQQRNRRYKAFIEQDFKKSLETKYNVKIIKNNWSSSSISPGTVFMSKLSCFIKKNIEDNFREIGIIFSDSSIPGEGEHKILPHLKNINNEETSIVYSPDADLIVLSVMIDKPNIFIMRDSVEPIGLDKFIYLSIDKCKETFYNEMTTDYEKIEDKKIEDKKIEDKKIEHKRILLDYSFLTFMCGNDFVIASHFLKIKEGGLDILLEIYRKHFNGEFLINVSSTGSSTESLNMTFFKKIINNLKDIEQKENQKFQKKLHHTRKGLAPKKEYSEELSPWKVELIKFQHLEYYNPEHPLFNVYAKVFDCINYFDDNWIKSYNKFFDLDEKTPEEYMKSLMYNLYYYTGKNENWTYFYDYRASPTFSDLYNYLEKEFVNVDTFTYKFEKNEPFSPLEQLLLILPEQSFSLLPKKLVDITKKYPDFLETYYPKKFKMNILHGHKFIYTDPILPKLDTGLTKLLVKKYEDSFAFI